MREPVLVASIVPAASRHDAFRSRHWRRDLRLGALALIAAVLTLPLAPSGHSPEIAAVLAVAAVALLAQHRWAVALVVVGELLLFPELVLRVAFPTDVADGAHLAAIGAGLAIVPGLLSMRRAAAALLVLTGVARRRARCRLATGGMIACGVAGALLAW